ncbi:MAG TPA: hypothetical protein VLT45_22620, partial [Kofleriaceae bacterium]|nr:hypothetical protein [Kofleriaceae bacterium]
MTRSIVVVVLASVAALVVLVLAGRRVLARDREALYQRYAAERTQDVEEAAHELGADLADLSEDLDLAATLLQNAESPDSAGRELHAIATIKREYAVIDARSDSANRTHVVAFDTPAGVPELAERVMTATLDAADAAPGTMQVSPAVRRPGEASWYRVYARRSVEHPVTIALLVDMRIVLGRVKLPREPLSHVLVLGPDGTPTPNSDDRLASLAGQHGGVMAPLDRGQRTTLIDADLAASVGLPRSPAVAVY